MTKQDHIELRETIESTLKGWHNDIVLREVITNKSLDNIDKHLEKLNGKISAHEQFINVNKANIETIPLIRDSIVSGKAVRNAIIIGITSAGTLFSIFFILWKLIIEKI